MGNQFTKKETKSKNEAKLSQISIPDKRPRALAQSRIIFVIGGPGSGKGTQCQLMSPVYGLLHISTGQLLRDEIVANTERGANVREIMAKGDLIPLEIVLGALKEALLHEAPSTKGFLIDGYPRELDQGVRFEEEVAPVECSVYLRVPDETMRQRLVRRGETSGRSDDSDAAIRRRIQEFHTHTQPVIEHYTRLNKLLTIEGDGTIEEVFTKICESLPKRRPHAHRS